MSRSVQEKFYTFKRYCKVVEETARNRRKATRQKTYLQSLLPSKDFPAFRSRWHIHKLHIFRESGFS
jgi:hypothetical protein